MRRRDGEIEFDAGQFRLRARLLAGLLAAFALALFARSVQIQVLDQQFLAEQGDSRSVRQEKMFAHRGAELDRNGEPLAVSSPVDSIWVVPSRAIIASDPAEKDTLLEPSSAERKPYRHPTFYVLPKSVDHM